MVPALCGSNARYHYATAGGAERLNQRRIDAAAKRYSHQLFNQGENPMKPGKKIALSILATALFAGNVMAQRTKVAPAQVFFDDAYEVVLPGDNAAAIKLDGLKSVRAVWLTFNSYTGGKPARDPQVMVLMEGTATKWGAPDGGCTYEFKIANGAAPSISMTKVGFCTLRDGEKVLFRVLAM